MERRGRSRAATRPTPQGRSNPTRCAKKKKTLHRGVFFFLSNDVGFEPQVAPHISAGWPHILPWGLPGERSLLARRESHPHSHIPNP